MTRPKLIKKVCCLPKNQTFGPIDSEMQSSDFIVLSIEEYETIRLMDYEQLTQQECAQYMNVARGTVQKLYADARFKLSVCIVDGKALRIQGGHYELYDESEKEHGCHRCRRQRKGKGSP